MSRLPRLLLLAAALAVLAPAALAQGAAAAATGEVTIRRTAFGIPHIERSYAGLGYGYALAEDNLCTMADTYVTVNAQRSRWFGPEAGYEQRGNGAVVTNLDSDLFWKEVIDPGVCARCSSAGPRSDRARTCAPRSAATWRIQPLSAQRRRGRTGSPIRAAGARTGCA